MRAHPGLDPADVIPAMLFHDMQQCHDSTLIPNLPPLSITLETDVQMFPNDATPLLQILLDALCRLMAPMIVCTPLPSLLPPTSQCTGETPRSKEPCIPSPEHQDPCSESLWPSPPVKQHCCSMALGAAKVLEDGAGLLSDCSSPITKLLEQVDDHGDTPCRLLLHTSDTQWRGCGASQGASGPSCLRGIPRGILLSCPSQGWTLHRWGVAIARYYGVATSLASTWSFLCRKRTL